ncbi:MAG: single-stranded DNA-binding protein [Actinomycetes bacterium]
MEPAEIPYENNVRLCGRVAREPVERVLPSGDTLTTMRVIVRRSKRARRRSRVTVDAFECVAWTSRLQRTLSRLHPDDVVAIEGELRRRFRRVAGAPVSRVEVELSACRAIDRAS